MRSQPILALWQDLQLLPIRRRLIADGLPWDVEPKAFLGDTLISSNEVEVLGDFKQERRISWKGKEECWS